MNKKAIYLGQFLAILLAVVLVTLSACSSPSTTPTQTATTGTSGSQSPSASRAPASSLASVPISSVLPTDTMFGYFVSNGNLTIFATALNQVNLVAELQGKGPYTVFVPTDEAFLKLPPLQKDAIFKDNAKLKQLLLYHFVQGEYPAAKLTPGNTLVTLQGESIKLGISNTGVLINDAKFVLADVPANDGVIHIIDKVLMPSTLSTP